MRIALAQINSKLGAFKENTDKIIDYIKRAKEKKTHLVIFSEMCLYGYPAFDSLENQENVKNQLKELSRISKEMPEGITAIIGAVLENKKKPGKPYHNSALILEKNKSVKSTAKQLLPTYDVFDENRFFEPGEKTLVTQINKVGRCAVVICEDMWANWKFPKGQYYKNDPLKKISKVDLIVNISASPFSLSHGRERLTMAAPYAKKYKSPLVYVNQVGGQDELIFDGGSFVLDSKGKIFAETTSFCEDLLIVDLSEKRTEYRPRDEDKDELLRKALTLGLRDYVHKTGFKSVHLGLSGGIDSALVAALAVDALGAANVMGLLLPGPYSSSGSVDDSLELAKNLKIKTEKIEILKPYEMVFEQLRSFAESETRLSILDQNIQARLRGLMLMGYSNARHSMLLNTTNKSEMAAGYGTLYGDLIGGICVIGDLSKEQVYKLSRYYNQQREIIPKRIFEKAPSAELAPNQKDQDTLPPYDELDKAVEKIMIKNAPVTTKTERWLQEALLKHEHKRWQVPPVLRVSEHAFGRGRRMPIAFG